MCEVADQSSQLLNTKPQTNSKENLEVHLPQSNCNPFYLNLSTTPEFVKPRAQLITQPQTYQPINKTNFNSVPCIAKDYQTSQSKDSSRLISPSNCSHLDFGQQSSFDFEDSTAKCSDVVSNATGSLLDMDISTLLMKVPSLDDDDVFYPQLPNNYKVPHNTPVDPLAVGELNASTDAFQDSLASLFNSSDLYNEEEWTSLFPKDEVTNCTAVSEPSSVFSLDGKNYQVQDPSPPLITTPSISPVTTPENALISHQHGEKRRLLDEVKEEDEEDDDDYEDDNKVDSKRRRLSNSKSSSSNKKKSPSPPVNPNDKTAVRRARNTEAARRSRDRRKQLIQDLQEKVSSQEQIITQLMTEVKILRQMVKLPN